MLIQVKFNTNKSMKKEWKNWLKQRRCLRQEKVNTKLWGMLITHILLPVTLGRSINFLKSTFTWEAKWTHTDLWFQTSTKKISVHMTLLFSCISKWPNILIGMHRYFILGSVYIIFYHLKLNFIFARMTTMK